MSACRQARTARRTYGLDRPEHPQPDYEEPGGGPLSPAHGTTDIMTNNTKIPVWRQRAACRGVDPDIFYPVSDEEAEDAKAHLRTVSGAAGLPRVGLDQPRERRRVGWGYRARTAEDHPPAPSFGLTAERVDRPASPGLLASRLPPRSRRRASTRSGRLRRWCSAAHLAGGVDLGRVEAASALTDVLEGNARRPRSRPSSSGCDARARRSKR